MTADEYWPDIETDGTFKARSVRGASVTAVAQVAKVILSLLSQIVLARLLLPGDFGLVAMVTPVIGFVQIVADLGLTQAVVSRPKLRLAELNSFFWINIGLSAALTLTAAALAPLLGWLYGEPKVIGVTLASAALILVSGAGTVQAALLNRQMRFRDLAVVEVGTLLASTAAGMAAAFLGCGYWSLVIAQAVWSVANTALFWLFSAWRPSRPRMDKGAVSLLAFGGNITVSNLAGYLNTTLDNVMIGAVLGRTVLGLYDRAWKLVVQPLQQIQAPFNRVAVPALVRLVDEPGRYSNAFFQMVQAMLLLVVPAMVFGSLRAEPLIGFVLGDRWLPTAPIFSWLCLGAAITPINSAVFWLFVSQGRAREQMVFGTAASAINVLAYAAGLHRGIVGVAAFSALSVYAIQTPLLLWAVCRAGPVGWAQMGRLLVPNTVAAIGAALALLALPSSLGVQGLIPLGIAAGVSFATYVMVLACFPSGRASLASLSAARSAFRRQAPA